MSKTITGMRRRDLLLKTCAVSLFCSLMLAMAAPLVGEQTPLSDRPTFVPYKERGISSTAPDDELRNLAMRGR
jgi:hypothetical protein